MNASIGSSGALRQNALAGYAFDGVGKRTLNGGPLRLNLPAAKIGSVICKRDFEVSSDPLSSF
jgi:hypothetical protein